MILFDGGSYAYGHELENPEIESYPYLFAKMGLMEGASPRRYANIAKNGKHFLKGLHKLKEKYPKIIKEVRGKGLLIGLCLHRDQTKFIQKLMDNKLLTIRAAENVVRLLPPLNVTKQEINLGLKILDKVCKNYR